MADRVVPVRVDIRKSSSSPEQRWRLRLKSVGMPLLELADVGVRGLA
jgi:hypothetical protein